MSWTVMSAVEKESAKPVFLQRLDQIKIKRSKRFRADGEASRIHIRAIVRPVVFLGGNSDMQQRTDDRFHTSFAKFLLNICQLTGDDDRISRQRKVRPVLFDGADRYQSDVG